MTNSKDNDKTHHSTPNAGTGDPTDGREPFEWETKYPKQARKEILLEFIYLSVIFAASFIGIFAIWKGWVSNLLNISNPGITVFKKYGYYSMSGLLGGVTFGIKYFYRVVARGYWHQDRRIWRIKSPFLSMAIAFIVGAMIEASLMSSNSTTSGASIISIGFLAGYFADQAVAKMYEIAEVVFGKSAAIKDGDDKK